MNHDVSPEQGNDKEISDINDIFESIAFSDDVAVKDGFQEGFQKGASDGQVEGFHLGYHRGIELGTEVGFFRGFAVMWLSLKDLKPGSVSEKAEKELHKLLETIGQFPNTNVVDIDIISLRDTLRSQYKKTCALLKINSTLPLVERLTF